jgi:hypothetical protein
VRSIRAERADQFSSVEEDTYFAAHAIENSLTCSFVMRKISKLAVRIPWPFCEPEAQLACQAEAAIAVMPRLRCGSA